MSQPRIQIISDNFEARLITQYLNATQRITTDYKTTSNEFLIWYPDDTGIFFLAPYISWYPHFKDLYSNEKCLLAPYTEKCTPPYDDTCFHSHYSEKQWIEALGIEKTARFNEIRIFFAKNYLKNEYIYHPYSCRYEIIDTITLINLKAEAMAWHRKDFMLLTQLKIANDRTHYKKNTIAALSDKTNNLSKLPITILKNVVSEFLSLSDAANIAGVNCKTSIAFASAGKPSISSANISTRCMFEEKKEKKTDSKKLPEHSRCIIM